MKELFLITLSNTGRESLLSILTEGITISEIIKVNLKEAPDHLKSVFTNIENSTTKFIFLCFSNHSLELLRFIYFITIRF